MAKRKAASRKPSRKPARKAKARTGASSRQPRKSAKAQTGRGLRSSAQKRGARGGRPKGPRSQTLPGFEKIRNGKLDNICESIAEERTRVNEAATEEKGLISSALQVMQKAGISVYRHARVELSRVPGAEKLRVRLTKEEGDAGVTDLEGPEEGEAGEEPPASERGIGGAEPGEE